MNSCIYLWVVSDAFDVCWRLMALLLLLLLFVVLGVVINVIPNTLCWKNMFSSFVFFLFIRVRRQSQTISSENLIWSTESIVCIFNGLKKIKRRNKSKQKHNITRYPTKFQRWFKVKMAAFPDFHILFLISQFPKPDNRANTSFSNITK